MSEMGLNIEWGNLAELDLKKALEELLDVQGQLGAIVAKGEEKWFGPDFQKLVAWYKGYGMSALNTAKDNLTAAHTYISNNVRMQIEQSK